MFIGGLYIVNAEDLTGMVFGRLTVISTGEDFVTNKGIHRMQWKCRCQCGNIVNVLPYNLKRGNTKSCGCLNSETRIKNSTTHGDRHTRLYRIWCGIKIRCYDSNNQDYIKYGARGITMCDEWRESYISFKVWAEAHGYSNDVADISIDRINVNGNYEPSNCRWANAKCQANNRRNTIRITAHGENHTLSEWADITGEKYHTLFARIYKLGWSPERAIKYNPNKCQG